MIKRGFADQFNFGHLANDLIGSDASAGDWNLIVTPTNGAGLDIASLVSEGHPAGAPVFAEGGDTTSGGPEGFAAGGKSGSGGTTSGGTTATTGSGTGTTSTAIGQGATTTTFFNVTSTWHALNPASGDSTAPTDSYFSGQWGLTNSTAGINVVKAWQNYTGNGVKVGAIDDGVDYNHPDLNKNYLFGLDYDARDHDLDAYTSATGDKHGTTVAGVISAARDGTGVVGVAYNAGFAEFRIGYGAYGSAAQNADAFNHAVSSGMDVINASWGYTTAYSDNFFSSGFASSKAAILNAVITGRGGLGTDIIFAAGNGRASGDDVNYHNYINDARVIAVAGTDTYGKMAGFSTPGAALLVSAPGTAKTDDDLGAAGYSSSDYINVSGTSYAAPYVSGVVALMLEANHNLGYRDVQQILAYSAKQNDPTSLGWQTNGAHDWNGGGLHFSQDYGFGLVDATAAVRLAESWTLQSTYANTSTESATHTDNAAIPDGLGSVKSTIHFSSSLMLDKVVVDLNITHAHVGDLTVTLTSPDGTTATLVSHPASGTGTGIVFETSANNFWGEDGKGDWTLTVTDNVTGNAGTLNSWTLTALGDAPTTPATYVYTDEFASAAGSDRLVLNDSSGNAAINTAAVTSGSYLDLHSGAFDIIAGKSLQIGTGTVIKAVWAGDGNDTIIANDAGDTIQGGRGNDVIVAGMGADKLYGGPGNDTFKFNLFSSAVDTIQDFVVGQDVIDLHQLMASVGYNGSDPVADHWLTLLSDSNGGTNFVVDPHNGQAATVIVDLVGISPALLHQGTDYWTSVHIV